VHDGELAVNPGDTTAFNALVNEGLLKFTGLALCITDSAVVMTVAAHTPVYDLRGAAFGKKMAWIESLVIDNVPLERWKVAEMDWWWAQTPEGQATRMMDEEPHHVRLWPTPAAVAVSAIATGYVLHPTLVLDADPVLLPDELVGPAACYVAFDLIGRGNNKDEVANLLLLGQKAAEAWAGKAKANRDRMMVRGRGRGSSWHRIG
jgi:hypothetical protein